MKDLIKGIAIKFLGLGNAHPTGETDKLNVLSLIRSLHPQHAGIDLIRLGPSGDGGYLIPDDLDGIEACFSPGVSDISGFEDECAKAGMRVFLADRSVDGPAVANERFCFTKKFIGALTSDEFTTIDDWVCSSLPGRTSDLLLQIDIEGCEYETFLSASPALMKRFRIIVCELHWLDHLWSKPFYRVAEPAIAKVLQTHSCVHVHPNNRCGLVRKKGIDIPRVMEFTFLRTDRCRGNSYVREFPHSLDVDNVSSKPPIVLPREWTREAETN